jgi:hypothetical protein
MLHILLEVLSCKENGQLRDKFGLSATTEHQEKLPLIGFLLSLRYGLWAFTFLVFRFLRRTYATHCSLI